MMPEATIELSKVSCQVWLSGSIAGSSPPLSAVRRRCNRPVLPMAWVKVSRLRPCVPTFMPEILWSIVYWPGRYRSQHRLFAKITRRAYTPHALCEHPIGLSAIVSSPSQANSSRMAVEGDEEDGQLKGHPASVWPLTVQRGRSHPYTWRTSPLMLVLAGGLAIMIVSPHYLAALSHPSDRPRVPYRAQTAMAAKDGDVPELAEYQKVSRLTLH
jgi:hypothetical protein